MYRHSLLALLSLLLLTGCMSRGQADDRLANGCAAGAEIFLEEGHKIKEIKDRQFRDDPALGAHFREVRLVIVDTDGWYDVDKEVKCIFNENYSGLSHAATIHQLRMDDKIWGKEGNEILGTMEEHLKLTETVEQGLNKK